MKKVQITPHFTLFKSTVGHYNFHYPSKEAIIHSGEALTGRLLPWVGSSTHVAIALDDEHVEVIGHKVVWIKQ
jgi:hypothetical protein